MVTAEGKIGGETFTDVNQTARPVSQANASQPTLISDWVTVKADASGKVLPNGNMADAHAEIGVRHKLLERLRGKHGAYCLWQSGLWLLPRRYSCNGREGWAHFSYS